VPGPSPFTFEELTVKTTVCNVRTAPRGSFLYVGRPSPWHKDPALRAGSIFGNPFRVGADGTIDEVLTKYRAYVLASGLLVARLAELRGKVLGCWCVDGDARTPSPPCCHGQVLAELADSLPTSRRARA
jgi:hypothetical protein